MEETTFQVVRLLWLLHDGDDGDDSLQAAEEVEGNKLDKAEEVADQAEVYRTLEQSAELHGLKHLISSTASAQPSLY